MPQIVFVIALRRWFQPGHKGWTVGFINKLPKSLALWFFFKDRCLLIQHTIFLNKTREHFVYSVNKSCVVHGHTDNKRDYIKKMDDESKFRCYHVVKKIKVENCEKRILMPKIGNDGSVIS